MTDTERMDWLEQHPTAYFTPDDIDAEADIIVGESSGINDRQFYDLGRGRTVREAIDAAMRKAQP